MMDHPEDRIDRLVDSLIGQFAKDLKKHNFNIGQFIKGYEIDEEALYEALDKMNFHYNWGVIKA